MITNLMITALITVVTNWSTIAIKNNHCSNPGCLLYHTPTYEQVGVVSVDTVIMTNGVKITIDSIPINIIQRIKPFEINDLTNEVELLKSKEKFYKCPTPELSRAVKRRRLE